MQGAQIQSLDRELDSHMLQLNILHVVVKKKFFFKRKTSEKKKKRKTSGKVGPLWLTKSITVTGIRGILFELSVDVALYPLPPSMSEGLRISCINFN